MSPDPFTCAPRSVEKLAALREKAWADLQVDFPEAAAAADGFTCDGCPRESTCLLAYDSYNIDGDCLWQK